jgi:hypothetical protein
MQGQRPRALPQTCLAVECPFRHSASNSLRPPPKIPSSPPRDPWSPWSSA